jgi:hypothetical protein
MRHLLEKYLKIYSHETGRFLWISGIFFAIFLVTALFRNYVDAAFLKNVGPQSVPEMLVINAILTFVIFGIADRIGRRYSDNFLLVGFLVFYAGASVVLFFLVRAQINLAYSILYQLLYLLDGVLLVYLWNIAGDLFDARQGKRLFPLVTAGQVLGTTIGSFSTGPLTNAFGSEPALIIFGAVCLGVGVFMATTSVRYLGSVGPKGTGAKSAARSVSLKEVPGLIKSFPIIRYLFITGLIPNILLPIFFYQFSVIANQTFPTQESLISFLGVFRGMTTLTTFFLLFFMGRLYSSMGITNASLVHPINFTAMFAALSVYFNIYVACYGQFTVILIQRAIAGPVNKILFNVVPSEVMAWSRTFVRGTVVKTGMLLGAVGMILLKPVMKPESFSYIAVVLSLYWVAETLFLRKHYKRILKQVIVEKQIDFEQIESVRAFDSGGSTMELGNVSVESRVDELVTEDIARSTVLPPEVALELLDDPNPNTRAEAASSFAVTRDIRAVRRLIACLEDPNEDVRAAAMEALMRFRESILPFLEVSLIHASPRAKQGILEVIRVSGLKEFEMIPFLGKELSRAYGNLQALRTLQALDGNGAPAIEMLKKHLVELNDEILSLIFYGLWVYHADMRLLYQALKSETASIAVEMIETSVHREMVPYVIPLIEDIPLAEKIEKGKKLFPLMRNENPERVLTFLVETGDQVTRTLALYALADLPPHESYIPTLESCLEDESASVRNMAQYALARVMNEVVTVPDIIDRINTLKSFTIFEGMGLRELHAIASVVTVEQFQPGDVIIKQGEENSSIYLLVSGKITIYDDYGTPREKEKVTVGQGAFIGELSLFTCLPPNATCVAADPCDAYVLRHHQFQEIMRVYPRIGINLCRFFTMKLRQMAY